MKIARTVESDPDVPNQLIRGKTGFPVVAGDVSREVGEILHLDENGGRRVLPGDYDVDLRRAFVPREKILRVTGLVLPELNLEKTKDLSAESDGAECSIKQVR